MWQSRVELQMSKWVRGTHSESLTAKNHKVVASNITIALSMNAACNSKVFMRTLGITIIIRSMITKLVREYET
jgi:hypothetical protein